MTPRSHSSQLRAMHRRGSPPSASKGTGSLLSFFGKKNPSTPCAAAHKENAPNGTSGRSGSSTTTRRPSPTSSNARKFDTSSCSSGRKSLSGSNERVARGSIRPRPSGSSLPEVVVIDKASNAESDRSSIKGTATTNKIRARSTSVCSSARGLDRDRGTSVTSRIARAERPKRHKSLPPPPSLGAIGAIDLTAMNEDNAHAEWNSAGSNVIRRTKNLQATTAIDMSRDDSHQKDVNSKANTSNVSSRGPRSVTKMSASAAAAAATAAGLMAEAEIVDGVDEEPRRGSQRSSAISNSAVQTPAAVKPPLRSAGAKRMRSASATSGPSSTGVNASGSASQSTPHPQLQRQRQGQTTTGRASSPSLSATNTGAGSRTKANAISRAQMRKPQDTMKTSPEAAKTPTNPQNDADKSYWSYTSASSSSATSSSNASSVHPPPSKKRRLALIRITPRRFENADTGRTEIKIIRGTDYYAMEHGYILGRGLESNREDKPALGIPITSNGVSRKHLQVIRSAHDSGAPQKKHEGEGVYLEAYKGIQNAVGILDQRKKVERIHALERRHSKTPSVEQIAPGKRKWMNVGDWLAMDLYEKDDWMPRYMYQLVAVPPPVPVGGSESAKKRMRPSSSAPDCAEEKSICATSKEATISKDTIAVPGTLPLADSTNNTTAKTVPSAVPPLPKGGSESARKRMTSSCSASDGGEKKPILTTSKDAARCQQTNAVLNTFPLMDSTKNTTDGNRGKGSGLLQPSAEVARPQRGSSNTVDPCGLVSSSSIGEKENAPPNKVDANTTHSTKVKGSLRVVPKADAAAAAASPPGDRKINITSDVGATPISPHDKTSYKAKQRTSDVASCDKKTHSDSILPVVDTCEADIARRFNEDVARHGDVAQKSPLKDDAGGVGCVTTTTATASATGLGPGVAADGDSVKPPATANTYSTGILPSQGQLRAERDAKSARGKAVVSASSNDVGFWNRTSTPEKKQDMGQGRKKDYNFPPAIADLSLSEDSPIDATTQSIGATSSTGSKVVSPVYDEKPAEEAKAKRKHVKKCPIHVDIFDEPATEKATDKVAEGEDRIFAPQINGSLCRSLWKALNSAEPQNGYRTLEEMVMVYGQVPNERMVQDIADMACRGPVSEGFRCVDVNKVDMALRFASTCMELFPPHEYKNGMSAMRLSWEDLKSSMGHCLKVDLFGRENGSLRIADTMDQASCGLEFVSNFLMGSDLVDTGTVVPFEQLSHIAKERLGGFLNCEGGTREAFKSVIRSTVRFWILNGSFARTSHTNPVDGACARATSRCFNAMVAFLAITGWVHCSKEGIALDSDDCCFLIRDSVNAELASDSSSPSLPAKDVKGMKRTLLVSMEPTLCTALCARLGRMLDVSKRDLVLLGIVQN